MKLERLLRAALDKIAIEVHRDDVVHGERAAHRGARVDEEGRRIAPRAAMTVMVDDRRALEHSNCVNKLLRHSVTRFFQRSQDRPTVARLIASALRPSSSSREAIFPPSVAA